MSGVTLAERLVAEIGEIAIANVTLNAFIPVYTAYVQSLSE